MNNPSFASQFMELWLDSDEYYVRIDLYQKTVTIIFSDWLNWHVDTAQVEIAGGIDHFIEPDGNIVGIRSCAHDNSFSLRREQ